MSEETTVQQTRVARWYFGGIASAGAASCTHPLDLIKVHLQTSTKMKGAKQPNLVSLTVDIVRKQGVLALYNGLSASLVRQLTYSTTRFGNVLSHAFDGLYKVYKEEGFRRLFNGGTTATSRAVLITVGQLSMYDQFKYLLLTYVGNVFEDNLLTHFTASLLAGACATTMTQPLDVIKTRLMNASRGEYNSILHCAKLIFKQSGPLGFFKGYVPAFVRLGPQTILTFIFFEQLRLRFGAIPS